MRINIPFGLHAYEDRSLPVNAQKLINFFVEAQPKDSKNQIVVNNTPGSALWVTVGNGPIHGMRVMENVLYVVSGTELYSITPTGVSTLLGTIAGNVRCSMEHNSIQMCIVNGTKGYIYDITTATLTDISSDPAFYPTNRVAFMYGHFIFPRTGTRQFFCSESYDGLTYDALDFGQLTVDPENVVSMIADHGELWVFSKNNTEVWAYNFQEATFPYSLLIGALVEKGCIAPHSPAKIDNSFFWLGHDMRVYRANGYHPDPISTHAIEHHIRSYSHVETAFGLTFVDQGHQFYELTFPDDDVTWRYDATTGLWHQAMNGNSGRYHANANVFFNQQNLIGDYRNGNIYQLGMDIYTDNGETIYRKASTPHIHSGRLRAVMDRLEIDIEAGIGLTTGQGSDPQLMLKYSDDGGRTWSNERWANMGRIGEYARRVRFSQLGTFYQRMFELNISDPIKGVIINAFADVEAEDSF